MASEGPLLVIFKVLKQYSAPESTETPTQKYTKFCCSKEMICTHCLLLTTNTEQAENHKSHDQSQPLWAVSGPLPGGQLQAWGFSTFSLVIQLYFLNNMNITFLQIPAQAKHCHQTSPHSLLTHYCPVLTGHRGTRLHGSVLPKKHIIQTATCALPSSPSLQRCLFLQCSFQWIISRQWKTRWLWSKPLHWQNELLQK